MKKIILPLALVGCCSFPSANSAEIDFSGFATFAGGITTDSEETYGEFNDELNFSQNSLIALQASADLGNGWGVTTQLMSRGSDGWEIGAEWAFVSYDADNDWRILFGRQRAPFYVYSDFLDVSYAYHWISPPDGVYSLPFDTFDGIGVIKNSAVGSFDSTFHATFGRNRGELDAQGVVAESDFSNTFSASWTLTRDWFTVRASYARTNFTVFDQSVGQLADAWRSAGFSAVGDGIEINDDTGDFKGIGIIIDYENFLLVSEYTEINPENSLFAPNDSYYLSLGYRTDGGMFHLTYGADENEPNFGLLDGVPSGLDPALDGLILLTQGTFQGLSEDSSFVTVGYKWDLDSPVSLKLEATAFSDDIDPNNDATLLQFAIVTVF